MLNITRQNREEIENEFMALILNKNDDYYVKIGLFSITIDYENFLIWKKENINIK